jgi:hypothetical protein
MAAPNKNYELKKNAVYILTVFSVTENFLSVEIQIYSFGCLFCSLLDSTAWGICTTCSTLPMPLHECIILHD